MAEVILKNIKKVYPHQEPKKKKKGEPEKKTNLQITEEGVLAVDNFNLHIQDKEFIVLVGPSGCGKSTTLRMVAGLEEISGGELYIGGQLMNDVAPKDRDISMVFQNYALYPHMTVRENIAFPLKLRKMDKAEIDQRVEQAAEILDITEYLDRKPKALSGGQRQRVAIGRAIVREPKVLLMDEPLSNLDAKLRVEMREEIRRIQREAGITTVFVTHDQEEASSIADRVVLLRDGVLQQEDTARGLYENPVNLFAADFLGTPPINQLHGVVQNGRLVLDGGIPAALALPDGLAEGQEIVLAVRAESILPQGDTPAFRTTVLERYSLGKDELVRLQAGPAELRGLVPAELEILPGAELAEKAGSLYPGGPAPVSRAALAGAIARELLALCPAFDCLDEYRARCFVPGHWVTVCAETETYAAKALAIDEEGRLVIQRENGRQEALRCGEVTTRPARTE